MPLPTLSSRRGASGWRPGAARCYEVRDIALGHLHALLERWDEAKLQTVRYEQVNAMLLNEFLRERRKVEK
jgi:hypothetical protein